MNLDLFPDGILVVDSQGFVEYANAAAIRMAGPEAKPLVGQHLREAMPLDDLSGHNWIDSVRPFGGLATRTSISERAWFSTDGHEFLVTASLVRERPAGKVIQLIISLRSSEQRNRLDRERSELVATVAHELRSPLTGVKGFTSTLLKNWDRFSNEQRKLILETIDSDADRLTRLITELLDAARIDAGRLTLRSEPVQITTLVDSVLRSVSAGSGHKHKLQIESTPSAIWADADRITQVVTNLVENAMRHGESLRSISVGGQGDGIYIRVADNGPGIDAEHRKRIFNRFWRSGPGAGSGLGMYIVKGVIDLHHGSIVIAEGSEGGAVITVTLPSNEPAVMRERGEAS